MDVNRRNRSLAYVGSFGEEVTNVFLCGALSKVGEKKLRWLLCCSPFNAGSLGPVPVMGPRLVWRPQAPMEPVWSATPAH